MAFIARFAALIARILIAPLFILAGFGKLLNVASTDQYIQAANLPAGLAIPAGIFEIVAGLLILFGLMQRLTAILLAGFCIVTAFFFHNNFADPMQQANFLKNLALAGGFIMLFAYGNMSSSLDGLRYRRLKERTRHDEAEAELRRERDIAHDRATAPRTVVVDDHRAIDGGYVDPVRR